MEVNISEACKFMIALGKLWEDGDFCDFTVVVEDTSYSCHRLVLSVCSTFFDRLFQSKLKECIEGSAKLDRMTNKTFNVIINAIYKGIDGLDKDNVIDVWFAVDLLEIDFLAHRCEEFLTHNLSADNCFRYLYHSLKYWPHEMCHVCLTFIAKHFEQVKTNDNFLLLPFLYFYKVITNDKLAANSEDSVVETILKWVEYATETLDEQTAEGRPPKAISLYSLGIGGNQENGDNNEETKHGYLEKDSDQEEEDSYKEEEDSDQVEENGDQEVEDRSDQEEHGSNKEEDDSNEEEDSDQEEDDDDHEEEGGNQVEDHGDQEEENGDQEEKHGDQEKECYCDQEKENFSQSEDIFSRLQCAEITALRNQMRFGSSLERRRAIIKLHFSNHITRKSNCKPCGISLFNGAPTRELLPNPTRVVPCTNQTVLIENRKLKFLKLISACRLFLARPDCLENLLKNYRDILVSTGAYSLVHKALRYTLNVGLRHDLWPEAAVHRDSSSQKHVMVFLSENKFKAYKFSTRSTHEFARVPEDFHDNIHNGRIAVFDNTLYFMYEDTDKGIIFRMLTKQKEWTLVNYRGLNACSRKMLLAHGSYIYDFKAENNNFVLSRYSCIHGDIREWKKKIHVGKTVGHCLVRFHQFIVVFGTKKNVVTAHYFNTETKKIEICNTSMAGTSHGMKSFACGEDVYILQRNGSLWKIFSTETIPINFEQVCEIWGFNCKLRGCVLYRKQLYIFCDNKNQLLFGKLRSSVIGICDGIKVIQINKHCVPMVLPQSWLN